MLVVGSAQPLSPRPGKRGDKFSAGERSAAFPMTNVLRGRGHYLCETLAQFAMSRTFQNGSASLLVSRAESPREKFDVSRQHAKRSSDRQSSIDRSRDRTREAPRAALSIPDSLRLRAGSAIFPAGNSYPTFSSIQKLGASAAERTSGRLDGADSNPPISTSRTRRFIVAVPIRTTLGTTERIMLVVR